MESSEWESKTSSQQDAESERRYTLELSARQLQALAIAAANDLRHAHATLEAASGRDVTPDDFDAVAKHVTDLEAIRDLLARVLSA